LAAYISYIFKEKQYIRIMHSFGMNGTLGLGMNGTLGLGMNGTLGPIFDYNRKGKTSFVWTIKLIVCSTVNEITVFLIYESCL
jgi:hypothetical protein